MSAASLPMPIDPARTDADWTYDITFYLDDLGTPEAWDGYTATLALVPRPEALRVSKSFLLTSEAAGGLEMLANGVAIRVAAAALADRAIGVYDFELRRHKDGAIEAVLVGSVAIEQGLSAIVAGQLATGPVVASGGTGGVKVVRGANGVRVVRGGGTRGPSGPPGVIIGPDEPDLQTGHQALWIQSGLGPDGDQFDIRIATGE